ncbi:ABC transporter substrate-binding protein [Nostoc sp. PA-18-2419]|uniref:ABC transporter substrate-binding protein n=1 Tax=Nostoc sp. PA-18-2419 TaxID=2575443 RepID=UPI0011090184|nr:ABC transporter substrate-binding protein [Nostoc sp. PA-18-2419]
MSPNSQNPYGANPYIIGPPIVNKHQLFGRETLLRTIEDSLQQNAKFILLHGQRRIGKSSVLKNIPLFISQDEFVFVPCDLQHHSYSTLGEILYAIANAIVERLNIDNTVLDTLKSRDLDNNPKLFTRRFLSTVYDILGNKKLVLLLDEFDVVTQNNTETAFAFLRFLENLVTQDEELFVIAVIGRYLDYMPNLVQSFRGGIYQEIGLIDDESTKQQITQPAENILLYQQPTIEQIIKFSAGHPYYTQVLCHAIFNQARDESYSRIIPDCVNDAVSLAIERAEGGLATIWDGLSISEKIVISAVAEAQKNTTENPFKLLEIYGIVLTNPLQKAIKSLINKGLLHINPVKIKVELVRLWLLKRHLLKNEIKSLEALEEEKISQLLSIARTCWQEGRQSNALNLYEQVLQLNPNHFSTILELAKKYLEVQSFDRALELYQRIYKLNPIGYQEEFIEALNQYGHWLITEKQYLSAKQQYEKILQIQLGNTLAQQRLAEIKAYQAKTNIITINYINNSIKQNYKLIIVILLVLIGGSIGCILFFSQLFSNCPVGQEKSSDRHCIPSTNPTPNPINTPISNVSISRGDRTLFPDIQNSDRDQGIDSFNKGNYTQAAQYFEKAVKNNHNDPEVLIYYNNAVALQKRNPLTLAAVVPAKNRTDPAKEMLRGIAQAQNQFNQKGGLNARLLEIVIADDDDKEDKAKQVAEQLVKDKSILGVIGHNSSHATDAALSTYTSVNLAVISPTSSSTKFQSPVFFRTVNSNAVTGKNLAEYAWKQNYKKVVIFCNPDETYSNTMREEFRHNFKGEIMDGGEKCNHNLAAPNFNADTEVRDIILAKNPAQAIVLFPDTEHLEIAGKITKAHKELIDKLQQTKNKNIQKLNLLGGDVLYDNNFLDNYSDALEGLVLSPPWFRDAPNSKEFAKKAKLQWGGGVSWATATSFDATQAFIKSFRLSQNPSQETVLKNLPQVHLSSKDTSGDELVFDKDTKEMSRKEILITVQNGKFVLIPK